MAKIEPKTICEALYWSYANLAMADKAVNDEVEKYKQLHFIIRSKMYYGLMKGTMNVRSLFHDEKSKLHADKCCVYCGSSEKLSIDHIIPQIKGGKDNGENLVLACRKCNCSKSNTDLIAWFQKKNEFPPIEILRNYLKLVIQYCKENNLMDFELNNCSELNLPFSIEHIPYKYPAPNQLIRRHSIRTNLIPV